MKNLPHLVVIMALLLLIACGGGGGGGSTTTGTSGVGPFSSIRLEATINGTTTYVDPTNIFTGEKIDFAITAIDGGVSGNPRIKVNVSNFVLTGSPGGTLTATGSYSGSSTPSPTSGTITASFEGIVLTTAVKVVQPQAVLTGRIRLTTGVGVNRVQLRALDSAGNEVANGLSTVDGTLRLSAPPSATKFTINFNVADPNASFYVRQFAYNGKDFSPGIAGCTATLPVLTSGNTSSLVTDVFTYFQSNTNPPPPPNGCTP